MKHAVNVVIRIKRIAIAMLLAAAGGLCVLLILPYTVPRHEIREAVLKSLQTATGVTPHIGAMHFSVLPQPGLRLDDVRFENANTGLTAGSLKATIKILPLLLGEVEVASLAFEQAHLNIEFRPDGVRLLGLPLRQPSAANTASTPEISLSNSVIDVHSVESGRVEKLSNVDASLAWSGAGLSTLASLRWRGIPSNVSLHIADAGALGENARSPARLRFSGATGASLDADAATSASDLRSASPGVPPADCSRSDRIPHGSRLCTAGSTHIETRLRLPDPIGFHTEGRRIPVLSIGIFRAIVARFR